MATASRCGWARGKTRRTAALEDLLQRAFAVGVQTLAAFPGTLGGADFVGVDDGEACAAGVVCQVEHHLDPRRQLSDRVAGQLIGNAVQPIGQRIGLLPQHREEQFVLRREMAIERPGRQAGALEDRGHRIGPLWRLGQAAVRSVDDALAVIGGRRIGLHDRRL